ncbi:hypothetical protein BT96DRAFT_814629 [Gymnopus androsaceus JB14]|uniref:BTB domain-containing protein n=1 Tax=Gymnopus androsaceus JB14 TaxID=1447944 RepID=A0A6A4I4I7_9AGAR|nr:hypothetical protein BT96DRAFT_814629 [Gymnopus androsaceus JB14]
MQSQPATIVPILLPRAFLQPPVSEPSEESLAAASGSSFSGQPAAFIRDQLESLGPRLLRTVGSVTAEVNSASLPKELAVIVNDLTATNYPTHMLAVYAPVPKNASRASIPQTEVKLYPVHALLMASHCARLGPFAPSPTTDQIPTPASNPSTITLPVRPMCLPSPETFPVLLNYLYLRRQEVLFDAFLPTGLSFEFVDNCNSTEHVISLGKDFGTKFNASTLLRHVKVIQGIWSNACVLGVFDEGLWAAIDSCYEVLLNVLAIGTSTSSSQA